MGLKNREGMTAACKWNAQVIVITVICMVILAGVALMTAFAATPDHIWLEYGLGVGFMVIVVTFAHTPRYLSIDRDRIVCKKMIGSVEIPVSMVISMEAIPPAVLKGSIRIFGSGGMFGYLGRFRNRAVGPYTMYATSSRNLLMVKTIARTYVFSCSKRDDFKEFFDNIKLK